MHICKFLHILKSALHPVNSRKNEKKNLRNRTVAGRLATEWFHKPKHETMTRHEKGHFSSHRRPDKKGNHSPDCHAGYDAKRTRRAFSHLAASGIQTPADTDGMRACNPGTPGPGDLLPAGDRKNERDRQMVRAIQKDLGNPA